MSAATTINSAVLPIGCPVCGLAHTLPALSPGHVAACTRCGSRISARSHASLARTAAFAIAALVLYVPANVFPILTLTLYGVTSDNTVWDGVTTFYQDGDYFMAGIVLIASIVVPLLKLSGLLMLCITVRFNLDRGHRVRTWLYRAIDGIGKWAMLDVFVLAIWVSVVKLGTLGSVKPGPGLLPFGCVVVLTLLASQSFDPQLIWEKKDAAE